MVLHYENSADKLSYVRSTCGDSEKCDPNRIRTAGLPYRKKPGATRPCDGFPSDCQQFGPLSSFRGEPRQPARDRVKVGSRGNQVAIGWQNARWGPPNGLEGFVGKSPLGLLARPFPRIAFCDPRVTIAAVMADQKLLPVEHIERAVLVLRGHRVPLAANLAVLYGVETKALTHQVHGQLTSSPAATKAPTVG